MLKYLVTALLLLATTTTVRAEKFEGTITYANGFTFSVKGTKSRLQITEGKDSLSYIADSSTKKMIALWGREKWALEGSIFKPPTPAVGSGGITLKKTGEKRKILGFHCDEYVVQGKDGRKAHLWVTNELSSPGFFIEMRSSTDGSVLPWPKEFIEQGSVALLITSEKGSLKATKAEEKILPDSLFKVPKNYDTKSWEEMIKAQATPEATGTAEPQLMRD